VRTAEALIHVSERQEGYLRIDCDKCDVADLSLRRDSVRLVCQGCPNRCKLNEEHPLVQWILRNPDTLQTRRPIEETHPVRAVLERTPTRCSNCVVKEFQINGNLTAALGLPSSPPGSVGSCCEEEDLDAPGSYDEQLRSYPPASCQPR
jgi:hypothetical protein